MLRLLKIIGEGIILFVIIAGALSAYVFLRETIRPIIYKPSLHKTFVTDKIKSKGVIVSHIKTDSTYWLDIQSTEVQMVEVGKEFYNLSSDKDTIK